jgi:hypothetical protein
MKPPTLEKLKTIERYVIHPAVGVSRLGNSEQWYYAPEVLGRPADPRVPSKSKRIEYKDSQGRIKKQAARFRVFGIDKDGKVVAEINDDLNKSGLEVEVKWSVHLANRKGAWYEYINPLDLDERSENGYPNTKKLAISPTQRNKSFGGVAYRKGPERKNLVIDPGSKTIKGIGKSSKPLVGKFMQTPVTLGRLHTDDKGRLVVIGGKGKADTVIHNNPPHHFANNYGWYDDTSDGTVRAEITIKGVSERKSITHTAEPSMVVVVPPNYGQGLYGVVTMLDVVKDVYYKKKKGGLTRPKTPSFKEHIWPMFKALSEAQWMNEGIYMLFGQGSPCNFTDPQVFQKLCEKDKTEFKKNIFSWFRSPNTEDFDPTQIPANYGDALRDFSGEPNDNLWITPTQYYWLGQWLKGDFKQDMKKLPSPESNFPLPKSSSKDPLENIDLNEQPKSLDEAALQECLGGVFRPGIEVTWNFRVEQLWKEIPEDNSLARFRMNIVDSDGKVRVNEEVQKELVDGKEEDVEVKDYYGPVLSPERAMAKYGPVHYSGPGTLTRWMGVPWQADAASCGGGYDTSTFLPLPTLWAPRAPQGVISEESVSRLTAKMADNPHSKFQKDKHFHFRKFWMRDLDNKDVVSRLTTMVSQWSGLGIVAAKEIDTTGLNEMIPPVLWVEQQRDKTFSYNEPTFIQVRVAEGELTPNQAKAEYTKAKEAKVKQAFANRDKGNFAQAKRGPIKDDNPLWFLNQLDYTGVDDAEKKIFIPNFRKDHNFFDR